ncbi:phosphonate ABC transporter, permease protein PhnE [Polynucleobacter sp. MWH-Loch1C5]|jgi:phosphonate transport system permease protein|uniref:phosphonate ABC transporter, permease protein PhnE n=1 Tax=Polynucleobacter sp. MWH-Loch1C5 TaxID=2689108 RepID=UPI001C0C9ABB|nr:phosphonate ABC transporter, permease protein PhnE [Polynucleobacter sp. MWH-Loch1C5]MBU3542982.1 phosphonate ABC transporter, permease protein PhnE [Polynucleobacter sp. MWH-Loch1C5]
MSSVALHPQLKDPAWHARLTWFFLGIVLLVPSLIATEFRPWLFFEAQNLKVTLKFLADFFPPNIQGDFLQLIALEAWRTIAIASAGTFLALILAVPLTLLSTRVLSISALTGKMNRLPFIFRQIIRGLLVLMRSIPELVWALVFVRVVGLGPAAGVLAIALTYAGMLGKIYGEILESGGTESSRALMTNGAGRLQTFLYAVLPQNLAELTSYTVYRWECAIRSSAVLGFVGAGGLGQQMDNSMKMFNGSEVATILLVFIVLVALADALSSQIRKILA